MEELLPYFSRPGVPFFRRRWPPNESPYVVTGLDIILIQTGSRRFHRAARPFVSYLLPPTPPLFLLCGPAPRGFVFTNFFDPPRGPFKVGSSLPVVDEEFLFLTAEALFPFFFLPRRLMFSL